MSETLPQVLLEEYLYELPPDRIAQYPLSERDQCRLLVAECRTRTIRHHTFAELPELLPAGTLLVRNVTKVVHARLFLRKPTGGVVEVLLLQPLEGSPEAGFAAHPPVEWECLLRGRRLRPGTELGLVVGRWRLHARLLDYAAGQASIWLDWQPATATLAELLQELGRVPLPPYLRREDEAADRELYQTVYASVPGSVAAPTAGLHFTETLFQRLKQAGIEIADVCLHVGMDTFKPVRVSDARQHKMHSEFLSVADSTLRVLREFFRHPDRQWLVAVGTTSVRTLETLYWHGVRLFVRRDSELWASPTLQLPQWEPYDLLRGPLPPPADAFEAILEWMQHHGIGQLQGTTELMIMPGYRYQLCDAIITNFHQPRSTLLLLVGAFVGEFWRDIYAEALAQGYRFLSYGDASLLICPRQLPR
ncbi:MAG: S-adenosylmethionine:tRNA ribosyltransferase-isomerase [Candidatus Kapabacteria bacterium]|nr:S-adenosylmethionine:tRNA ribosyltransferase-isomerase [Candidatus Kapabacteria bacterium]MDW8011809.1 S-adenosylmethionine:tRNA ribosyltransferase-isomerase [Bacteroidota bacterium]